MKILNKEELNRQLGKESFWFPKRLVNVLHYFAGIEEFDAILGGKSFNDAGALINICKRPKGLQVEIAKNLKWQLIGLLESDIQHITLEDKEQIFIKKDKSVVGRALIGGLLLGPVGAIVGGMTGIGEKEVKAEMPELILSINHETGGIPSVILFSCKFSDKSKVEQFFKSHPKFSLSN